MAKNNKYAQEAADSRRFRRDNNKKPFKKEKKTNDKFSMKKQIERKHQPIPRSVEEWDGHRGLIEYQMGKDMAADILALRKGKEKGIDPQKWLCDYINEQEGLIGYCIKVVIAG